MNLADILAALIDLDEDDRAARIDELLADPDIDLIALRDELSNMAGELTTIEPADMSDEQITQAEIVAQLLVIVEQHINDMEMAAAAVENNVTAAADGDDTTSTEQDAPSSVDARAKEQEHARARSRQERAKNAIANAAVARQKVQETAEQHAANTTRTSLESTAPAQEVEVAQQESQGEVVMGEPIPASGGRRRSVPLNNVVPAPDNSNAANALAVRHSVIAAGDLPGYRPGQELNTTQEISQAVHAGMSIVSRSQSPTLRQTLASIRREAPEHLRYRNESDWHKVDAVTDQRNLPKGSLVAAGGWCAPSEVVYTTCPITVSSDGMVDLPTITTSRGGIKYSGKPDFSSIWAGVGFAQSELDAIAGVEKRCYTPTCENDLLECRLEIQGLCLKQPILTEQGWPEKAEEFLEYAMLAHAHKMNAERIRRMVSLATYQFTVEAPDNPQEASIFDPHGPGAFESLLSVLELQVEYFRYSGRLARNAVLEAIAPFWLRGLLRADISKKLGIDDRWGAGSDIALDRWFRDRGVAIQWVYDWQDSMADGDPSSFGGSIPTQWPTQVQILLYEPGTYFALQQDVITLSGIYDSVDLQKNIYTRLFTEEGYAVCSRCGRSMLLTLNLCPNGLSGTQQRTQCGPVDVAA